MEKTNKSGLATAGLVLGIVGVCTSFIPIVNNISFIMGILSAIFGIISLVKKTGKGKAITAIILGILAITIIINLQQELSNSIETVNKELDKAVGNSTEEVLKNDVEVLLGSFEVEKGEYFTDTKLTVKVTNKMNEKKSFSINIEAINEINADENLKNNALQKMKDVKKKKKRQKQCRRKQMMSLMKIARNKKYKSYTERIKK